MKIGLVRGLLQIKAGGSLLRLLVVSGAKPRGPLCERFARPRLEWVQDIDAISNGRSKGR